jgi:hypothetical protein
MSKSNSGNVMYEVIYHYGEKEDSDECDARSCWTFDDCEDEVRGVFDNKKSAAKFVKESATDAVDTWTYCNFSNETKARKEDIAHQIKHHYTINTLIKN